MEALLTAPADAERMTDVKKAIALNIFPTLGCYQLYRRAERFTERPTFADKSLDHAKPGKCRVAHFGEMSEKR